MTAPCLPANQTDTELQAAMAVEEEYIKARRGSNGAGAEEGPRTGLALSGGGIRSATFSLGILQALSRHGLLRRFDYLSTVSGGSYIGSFFGALYVPPEKRRGKQLSPQEQSDFVEQPLQSDRGQKAVANLREFGRYLTPGGASDTMYGIATIGRNWVMLQCVLGLLPLLMFLTIRLLQTPELVRGKLQYLQTALNTLQIPNALGTASFRQTAGELLDKLSGQEFSGLFMLLTFGSGLLVLAAGMAYWYSRREAIPANLVWRLVSNGPLVAAIAATGAAILSLKAESMSDLSAKFLSIACLAADPKLCPDHAPFSTLIVIFVLGWSALFYLLALWRIRRVTSKSPLSPAIEEESIRSNLTRTQANLLLITLALGAATLIDFLGGRLAAATLNFSDNADQIAGYVAQGKTFRGLRLFWHFFWPFVAVAAPATLTVWAHGSLRRGSGPGWLTRPAGQGALGISILFFWLVIWAAVARSLSLDVNVGAQEAETASKGGLLLAAWLLTLVAVVVIALCYGFLNQSSLVSLYSTRLKRAYVGASNPVPGDHGFDIGREGDSISMETYYGKADEPSLALHRPVHLINMTIAQTQPDGSSHVVAYDRKGKPMHVSPAGLIYESGGAGRSDRKGFDDGEELTLSTWTAISGAAASTAIGGMTSLGLSILAMMANVRLGYWWKSNKRPWYKLKSLWWDTVHGYLTAEMQSNFATNPNRQRWHLTDGGHFENTGAYALIQRRLDLIVVCDNGADPDYRLDDVVRLIERARSDLKAEISFLDSGELDAKFGENSPLRRFFGAYGDLASTPSDSTAERLGKPMPYATLARIEYDLDLRGLKSAKGNATPKEGLLILIKPRLNFSEPPELLAYRKREVGTGFPQQTTLDQFFDEEQWEAYRRFGEIVGERIFDDAPGTWTPSQALGKAQKQAGKKANG